jgi:Putative prokaryotic signal transducing protein
MATPGNPQDVRGDYQDLVEVFGSERESEVFVVKGLLEAAGIDCMTRNFDAPQDVLPGVGGVAVLVRADQANEARQMIEDYRANGPASADEAEANSETGSVTEPPTTA